MRMRILLLLTFILAACQPQGLPAPTPAPLATITPGLALQGLLATPGTGSGASPATAVAIVLRATATPNREICPPINPAIRLAATMPETREAANSALLSFLTAGGNPEDLERILLQNWQRDIDTSYIRRDVDLTGEGTPEILIGYTAPGDLGTLLVIGCTAGQAALLHEVTGDGAAAPQLIWAGDINRSGRSNLFLARRICPTADSCEFDIQVLEWEAPRARLVNLLDSELRTLDLPALRDIDGDEVSEIVVELTSRGNAATGPLRTGLNIYDWDGSVYTLSIVQLDPPRYRIQVIHQGDREFSRLQMTNAIQLYTLALAEESDLREWFNDGGPLERSYALYRLILAHAYLGEPENAQAVQEAALALSTEFGLPNEEAPVPLPIYARMAYAFVNALVVTNDLHSACVEVQAIIEREPAALQLINRYGRRSPTYSALDLCPF